MPDVKCHRCGEYYPIEDHEYQGFCEVCNLVVEAKVIKLKGSFKPEYFAIKIKTHLIDNPKEKVEVTFRLSEGRYHSTFDPDEVSQVNAKAEKWFTLIANKLNS